MRLQPYCASTDVEDYLRGGARGRGQPRVGGDAGAAMPEAGFGQPSGVRARAALGFFIVGGFYSEVVLQKREAEGTLNTS